jgi:hypothetical protein
MLCLKLSGPEEIAVEAGRFQIPIDHQHIAPGARELDSSVCQRQGAADAALPRIESDDEASDRGQRHGVCGYTIKRGTTRSEGCGGG